MRGLFRLPSPNLGTMHCKRRRSQASAHIFMLQGATSICRSAAGSHACSLVAASAAFICSVELSVFKECSLQHRHALGGAARDTRAPPVCAAPRASSGGGEGKGKRNQIIGNCAPAAPFVAYTWRARDAGAVACARSRCWRRWAWARSARCRPPRPSTGSSRTAWAAWGACRSPRASATPSTPT